MAENRYYLVTAPVPDGRPGLLALITLGSRRHGDANVTVLSLEVVEDQEEAEEWFASEIVTQPWRNG